MRYKAKKDFWVVVMMYLPLIITIGLLIPLWGKEVLFMLAVLVPVDALTLWICYGSYYELREKDLYIRFGPFRQKIPYQQIRSLRETRNFFSSVALSLDRIEIREHDKSFAMGTTYVAPLDKGNFLKELKKRCQNLEEFAQA